MKVISTKSYEQYHREQFRRNSSVQPLWQLLDQVKDPEIPVLSLWDIGILKDIKQNSEEVIVTVTPTYSGCPAMDIIKEDIEQLLYTNGYKKVTVVSELSPPWTTEWMTEKGKKQLRDYGIATPTDILPCKRGHHDELHSTIICPHCSSENTTMISEFGSTACKALFKCNDCCEPFDLFKKL
jgi:ring-1,2-phenylacetyl-CoA epoxidase subunit PaaD